jgi:hypothetical protein
VEEERPATVSVARSLQHGGKRGKTFHRGNEGPSNMVQVDGRKICGCVEIPE